MMRNAPVTLSLAALLGVGTFGSSVAQDIDIGYGGRVEVPDSGVALTLPDDWVYVFPAPEMTEAALAYDEEMEDDPLTAAQSDLVRNEMMSVTLLAFAPDRAGSQYQENCQLVTRAASTLAGVLDLWVAAELAAFANDDAAERPSVSYIDLNVGRVARLDYDTDDWAGRAQASVYLVPGDHSRHWLNCVGEERPEDRWLSIAETVEWLPSEE